MFVLIIISSENFVKVINAYQDVRYRFRYPFLASKGNLAFRWFSRLEAMCVGTGTNIIFNQKKNDYYALPLGGLLTILERVNLDTNLEFKIFGLF